MEEQNEIKEFHIGTVLSITHDALLSPDHIDGVYSILNHMTGDNLFTHQLPRAGEICKPALLRAFPVLRSPAAQELVDTLVSDLRSWGKIPKDEQMQRMGNELVQIAIQLDLPVIMAVGKLNSKDWKHINPVTEMEAALAKARGEN
jgi:hypothetical protein